MESTFTISSHPSDKIAKVSSLTPSPMLMFPSLLVSIASKISLAKVIASTQLISPGHTVGGISHGQ